MQGARVKANEVLEMLKIIAKLYKLLTSKRGYKF